VQGIFIVTASSSAAAANLNTSVWNPLDRDLVAQLAPNAVQVADAGGHDLRAWGVSAAGHNLPKWERMRSGDWVLFFAHKRFVCVAQTIYQERLPSFAEAAWGSMDDQRTWELVCFLTKPRRVSVPVETVSEYLHTKYQGFARIMEDRLERIQRDFGSTNAFVESYFPEADTSNEITLEDVRAAVRSFEQGAGTEFGPSVVYDLMFEGRTYPPKVIYALACRRTFGRALSPAEVSSGESSVCFHALRALGIEIRRRELQQA
jgi:hypothetical protein